MPANPTPLTPEARELAAAHLPLALAIARRSARDPRDRESTADAAVDALIAAARAFDPARGLQFATLVGASARRAIKDRRNWDHRAKRAPARDVLPLRPDDSGLAVPGRLPDDDEDFDGLLAPLSADLRAILRLRHGEGLDGAATARRLGISRRWAWACERRALATLRDAMARESVRCSS